VLTEFAVDWAVSGNARVANRSGVLARPIGLRHGRGQRRATIAVDLAVDRDYRNRIPAPALHDDVDRPAGFHRNG
jgi:hypothetical protein